MRTSLRTIGLLAAALALALAGGQAAAGIIDPGFDHLKTQPGSFWDFGAEPLDGGYFGPGSDPFEGQVAVITDTRVWRVLGSVFTQNPDVIPTEIVALELHSAAPVPITFDGGQRTVLYDVVVTLDPSAPSGGHYLLSLDPSAPLEGGLILGQPGPPVPPPPPPDSFFDVFFRFEFIPQGGGMMATATRSDHVVLTEDVPWCSTAPALYYRADAGSFFPGIDPFAVPPNPIVPQTMVYQGEAFTWHLRLEPVPEPATLSLLALGGFLGLLRRRKR